jgi:cytochrome c553
MRGLLAYLTLVLVCRPNHAADLAPAEVEFFEAKVRPILVEACQQCHGAKKQQGGLRLDSAAALAKGADTGPVVVAGKPEQSGLIKSVRYEGDYHMPPKGKLPAEQIATLTEWVRRGAPWPASVATPSAEVVAATTAKHWAFQPLALPPLPAVADAAWVRTPVDRFILQALAAKQIAPAPPADKRTLLRRVTYDLTGLPPTPDELDAFLADAAPNAYAKVVERLLASPHYGERWGRYWLDLARYADTKGYVFQEDRNYPFAYTYRDWVVTALNADMPYDRFLMLQLAADRMDVGADKKHLAALGFMTVGRRFLNNIADIIDDRIDVLTRSTLGLTVTCARCHDHKFDPIPTKDYYSLYGVFNSSLEPKELPLIGEVERTPELTKFEAEVGKRQADITALIAKRHAELTAKLRKPEVIAQYLLAAHATNGQPNDKVDALVKERDLNKFVLTRWRTQLAESAKANEPVFAIWHAVAKLKDDDVATQVATVSANAKTAPPALVQALTAAKLTNRADVANVYGQVLARADSPPLQAALTAANAAVNVPVADTDKLFQRDDRNRLQALQKKLDEFRAKSPVNPPRAMVLNDTPKPNEPFVFVRGNPGNRGPTVPRQFLEVLSGPQRTPFKDGSGRLELARAIASPTNPLTARVFVNRVWLSHFGRGLVDTPSDFGIRTPAPSHPELLDWLASQFIRDGWSIKQLHRHMVLSNTYQQASVDRPELRTLDPENRLWAKMNRRRLDWEALRDSLLVASGELNRKIGGPAVEMFKPPFMTRRTLYGFIDRQNLPGTFRTFDFASPDQHSPQRYATTVPQQALYLLNSPFVMEQAQKLLKRPEVASPSDPALRITQMYRLLYGRGPTPAEVQLAQAFVTAAAEPAAEEASVWQYGWGQVDEKTGQVRGFTKLPYFTGSAWQGSAQLPDPKVGWATLTATGGHPGDAQHAVVRRWVAPFAGTVRVTGTLQHPNAKGDGVQGRVVSSRQGIVGAWGAHNRSVATPVAQVLVQPGDTLDWVVDCRGAVESDSFAWTVSVQRIEAPANSTNVWDAARDFRGPAPVARLSPWEQYAQALLLANEFAFVD